MSKTAPFHIEPSFNHHDNDTPCVRRWTVREDGNRMTPHSFDTEAEARRWCNALNAAYGLGRKDTP